jgi:hypothetical protein
MRLVECAAPASAVSVAPLTALCDSHSVTVPTVSQMADGRLIAGFWGLDDDRYYVRESSEAGDAWYTVMDDEPSLDVPQAPAARVLPIRTRDAATMRVTYRQDDAAGRTLIVGVSHARSRGR